ncbi:hypothetical protein QBC47DRAFT_371067 [Echria macrotheca]|uniref:F-box domain-containing protein n=1 Tax=Echria macrotheca TaxID=438768 RepID=A0AAJ0BJG8_9PEZI|nr:hypothetical protein QBC47DRAFT_371067 [Echria macrotheca]
MASLSCFPPETLLNVFSFLGPQFFADNLELLTVSKGWYGCARRVLLSHPCLKSAKSLVRFTADPRLLAQRAHLISSLDVTLSKRDSADASLSEEAWISRQKSALAALVSALKGSARLRHLKVNIMPGPEEYLGCAAIHDLLSLRQLSTLHLDVSGYDTHLEMSHGRNLHLCEAVNNLILYSPSLRDIRIKLDRECDRLFAFPETLPEGALQNLETVILDMRLNGSWRQSPPGIHSGQALPCNYAPNTPSQTKRGHREEVGQQAVRFAKHAPKLKLLRILASSDVMGLFPRGGFAAHDLLSNKWFAVQPNAPWDSAGREFTPRYQVDIDEDDGDIGSDEEEEVEASEAGESEADDGGDIASDEEVEDSDVAGSETEDPGDEDNNSEGSEETSGSSDEEEGDAALLMLAAFCGAAAATVHMRRTYQAV